MVLFPPTRPCTTHARTDELPGPHAPDSQTVFARGQLVRGEPVRIRVGSPSVETLLGGADISAETLDVSADLRQIAYTSLPENALCVVNRDGSGQRRILPSSIRAALPHWSVDGTRMAVMLRRPGEPWRIAVVSADGRIVQDLTHENLNEADPSWAPDQIRIVFGRIPALSEPAQIALFTIDVATRAMSVLPGSSGLFDPEWSPDGRYIAALNAASFHLNVLDVAAGTWSEVTNSAAGFPTWSADSKTVAFLDPNARDLSVCAVNIRTRAVHPLVTVKGFGSRQLPLAAGSAWAATDRSTPFVT